MVAGLKHYTAYSVEEDRYSRIFNISMHDLWETYLSQYKVGSMIVYGPACIDESSGSAYIAGSSLLLSLFRWLLPWTKGTQLQPCAPILVSMVSPCVPTTTYSIRS